MATGTCKSVLPPRFEQRVSRLQDRYANHHTTAAYTTQEYLWAPGSHHEHWFWRHLVSAGGLLNFGNRSVLLPWWDVDGLTAEHAIEYDKNNVFLAILTLLLACTLVS